MRSAGWACLLAGVGAACGPQPIDLFLGLPRPAGAESLVVGATTQGGLQLYGANLADPRLAVRFEWAEEATTIEAVALRLSLDDQGLTEGLLSAASGVEGWRLPTDPVQAYQAEILPNEDVSRWVETDRVDRAFMSYLVEQDLPPCQAFAAFDRSWHFDATTTFQVRVDPRHVLMGTRGLELPLISDEAGVVLLDPPGAGYVRVAFAHADRGITYADWFGDFFVGRVGTSAVIEERALPPSPIGSQVEAIAGEGDRFVAVSATGVAAFFDGQSWTLLPQVAVPQDTRPKAAWANGVGYYWVRGRDELVRVSPDGTGTNESLGLGGGVFSIRDVPGLGTVLGSGDGRLFVESSGGWSGLGGDYGWWALDSEPYLDGFFFLLASGSVGQFRPNRPLCPDQPVIGIINDGALSAIEGGMVVSGWEAQIGTNVLFVGFD